MMIKPSYSILDRSSSNELTKPPVSLNALELAIKFKKNRPCIKSAPMLSEDLIEWLIRDNQLYETIYIPYVGNDGYYKSGKIRWIELDGIVYMFDIPDYVFSRRIRDTTFDHEELSREDNHWGDLELRLADYKDFKRSTYIGPEDEKCICGTGIAYIKEMKFFGGHRMKYLKCNSCGYEYANAAVSKWNKDQALKQMKRTSTIAPLFQRNKCNVVRESEEGIRTT